MRSRQDIVLLLDMLETCCADDLEDQDLDFKEWNQRSMADTVKTVIDWAVCMANGGGGTVVFGVRDGVVGREKALVGVPVDADINRLKKAVYDATDPKLTPVFEELPIPEGTGRLIVMQVHPGMPPYTDTAGRAKIRIGKTCQPLTGTLRRKLMVESGLTDYTAEPVDGNPSDLLSPAAMEALRNNARAEQAPGDLLQMADMELMNALGLVRDKHLTRAAVLLGGTEAAIRNCIPGYAWTFLHMTSDSRYDIRDDRCLAIALSVNRLEELVLPFNPITTHESGLFHHEYRAYPVTALREGLMNAFCHADLRIAGPIMVKLFADSIEISNNGGFIGGITAENILHHQPAARNPMLVNALVRLRLVNRSNLGISRMFKAFLMEGKKPPIIDDSGDSVRLTLLNTAPDLKFRAYVADAAGQPHGPLNVDELLILNTLRQNRIITLNKASHACQRPPTEVVTVLERLAQRGALQPHSNIEAGLWTLAADLFSKPAPMSKDDAVDTVLATLKSAGSKGLRNTEIQAICGISRSRVKRIMNDLKTQGRVILKGKGQASRWHSRDA